MEESPAGPASPAVAINMESSLPQAQDTEMAIHNGAADQRVDWAVNICLSFAAQPVQTTTSASNAYAEAGLALVMCAFASLFLGKSRCFGYKTSGVMQRLGVFFGFTALFVRVTAQSSVWLKCAGGIVYSLTWLAVFVLPLVKKPVPVSPVNEWMVKIWARVKGVLCPLGLT